ncbi:MAG: C25 family cysteine peptidase [bacterium]
MKNIFILIFIITSVNISYSNTIDITLTFDPDNVIFSKEMGYDTIKYPDTLQMGNLGKPMLPMLSVYVSIPFKSTVNSISIVNSQTQDIQGDFLIYPAQLPIPKGEYNIKSNFILPDPSVYNNDQFYPQLPYSEPFVSSLNGADMGGITVYPFRYNPIDSNLELFTSLTLRLNYTPPSPTPSAVRYMEDRNKDLIIENVKSIVKNPDDVDDNFEPIIEYSFYNSPPHNDYSLSAPDPTDRTSKPNDMLFPYTYVIITNDRYCGGSPTNETDGIPDECNPLSNWRTELGVPATLRTVEWIKQNYWERESENEDLQKSIRDFLTDAWKYWGTQWLIIVGDLDITKPFAGELNKKYSIGYTGIVPARFLCSDNFGFVEDGIIRNKIVPPIGNQNYTPCDLYYMDLTDEFNGDDDNFYGERHDIYNYPFNYDINIFRGRVPADKETEVQSFVNKLLHYEKLDFLLSPTGTYLSKCLQVASDGGNEELYKFENENYLPMFTINNIYEGFYNDPDNPNNSEARYTDYPEPWQIVEEINNNPSGIINFDTHGRPDGFLMLTHISDYPPLTVQWLSTYHKYTNFFVHS